MKLLSCIAIVVSLRISAAAALITGGFVNEPIFSSPGGSNEGLGKFAVQLTDGYYVSGFSSAGTGVYSQCFTASGSCTFRTSFFAPLNNSDSGTATPEPGGFLQFVGPIVTPSSAPGEQIIRFPFTATGRVSGPAFVENTAPCPLPTPDTPLYCNETVTGSGTGQITIFNSVGINGHYEVTNLAFVFAAPEPSTFFMIPLGLAGLVFLKSRQASSRRLTNQGGN